MMAAPRDVADLLRKVGGASKALRPKSIKLGIAPQSRSLSKPIGSLKPSGLSMGAEDAFGVFKANRRRQVGGTLGGKAPVGGIGARSLGGRQRVRFK